MLSSSDFQYTLIHFSAGSFARSRWPNSTIPPDADFPEAPFQAEIPAARFIIDCRAGLPAQSFSRPVPIFAADFFCSSLLLFSAGFSASGTRFSSSDFVHFLLLLPFHAKVLQEF